VTYLEKIWNCLIIMGDLPRKKNKMKSGLIVMGDLPRWKKKMWSCLIVMGDLPRKKDEKWSHCNGWPTQMEKKNEVVSL
jgi:hypothetical protein